MSATLPKTHLKTPLKPMLFVAAVAAAALGIAVPAFAQDAPPPPAAAQHCSGTHHHGQHGWRHHRGMMMMRGLHQLDLSDAQKQSIHAAFKSSREGMRVQFKGLMQQRRAFETAVPGTPEFNTAYGSYAQSAATATEARVKAEADLKTRIYNLLTDAQRAKLATMQTQHHHWQHHQQSSQG